MAGQEPKYTSFSNKDLKDSLFFINVMAKMEPRAVDWDLVNKGKENNIKLY